MATTNERKEMPRFHHLPEALRLLREQRGYSQRRVAEALGVEASLVGSWERGKRLPPPDRFFQLADLYDLDLGDFDDALEIAGGPVRRRRQSGLTPDELDPRRLARRMLDREQRLAFDPVENDLFNVLEALSKLAERLRSTPQE